MADFTTEMSRLRLRLARGEISPAEFLRDARRIAATFNARKARG